MRNTLDAPGRPTTSILQRLGRVVAGLSLGLGLLGLAALPEHAMAQDDDLEEVVVWGDLFARWDNTRWFVQTELVLPLPLVMAKDDGLEFLTSTFQLRTIIACSKEARLSKRKQEIDCVLEDFGMKAALRRDDGKAAAKATARMETRKEQGRVDADKLTRLQKVQLVLDEIDAKLSGAKLQLQVSSDGRVTNIDLEGIDADNRRESRIQETLRQLLSRVAIGFDMKLRKGNQLNEGKWMEYKSNLMTMPLPPPNTASSGSSMMQHYINKYKGHVIVQSIGKGTIQTGDGVSAMRFGTEFIGVSLFDQEEGYMTERVWALTGTSNASNIFNAGQYYHAGKITKLGENDRPSCGTTGIVSQPGQELDGVDPWVPIERN